MPTSEFPAPHLFQSEQWVPYPLEVTFAFFAMPENLPRIMPKWQKVRIEEANFTAPPPRPKSNIALRSFAAGSGTRLTVSFRPFPLCPIRIPWRSRITHFEWNDFFCDEQEEGPFAYWKQCHRFRNEQRNGCDGTRVLDELEYVLPLGALGKAANAIFMRRQLRSTFDHRHKATQEWLQRVAGPYKTN